MTNREKYIIVLKKIDDWTNTKNWAEEIAKEFPDLLEHVDLQAKKHNKPSTGLAEIRRRLDSDLSSNGLKYVETKLDKEKKHKLARYNENFNQEENLMNIINSTDEFYEHYKKSGFYFPTPLLTTYALSLHTKPFVLLSGISGTGKTKISQLFNVMETSEKDEDVPVDTESFIIKVPKTFDRFNFPQKLLATILTEKELAEFNKNAEKFKKSGSGGNFTKAHILTIEDKFGEFKIGVYGQRASSPLIRARYKKSRTDKTGEDYDSTKHLSQNYNVGDILKLEKTGEKTFKVVSVNDTTVKQQVEAHDLNTIQRFCFIPVKSDWTDSSELFGFYNLIEQKYHITKFLDFILTARNNPEYPFFVLFDEMNLSKVEHYFSDVLSCLESRRMEEDNMLQEPIPLYNGLNTLVTDSEKFEEIPNSIELPTNLYITGTVNIDESTYMFSPKVLDRANVIEFNEVNLDTYGKELPTDDDQYKLKDFPNFTELNLATMESYKGLPPKIKTHLIEINAILKEYHLHFGYRTANEVALYINNAIKYIDNTEITQLTALDNQLVQKVFPKLNGSYAMLEAPLNKILKYLSKQDDISKIKAEDTLFPKTINKLQKMYHKLATSGYTSFID
ncbi:McrB family protein [Poseidonibacter lekithochrous]|uniref:McrB family protein n=1 Tax=Poseidonibacter lekithochrous TaxID=1904463 RepID=UPI0008FC3317|nr:hypothetical protein [Poseidonibacter lekithochrous]QKJ23667.1 hypothetical protein ALEK_2412 [Poseidonibacter lekithochrous]